MSSRLHRGEWRVPGTASPGKPMAAEARTGKRVKTAIRLLPGLFMLLALMVLGREVRTIRGAHIWEGLAAIEPWQWAAALAMTASGYALLTLYDLLGSRLLGIALPYGALARGAFLSFTLSNNVGLGWLSGGAMRERVYGPLGMSFADVARLTILNSVTFFIGGVALLGSVLIAEPALLKTITAASNPEARTAGLVLLAAVALYLAACASRLRTVGRGQLAIPLPTLRVAFAQMLLSMADIALAAGALYVLLPDSVQPGIAAFFGIYLIALGVSIVTHVPGGLGVFETLILLSLPMAPKAELVASLIAFRLVYYLVPLTIALLMLGRGSASRARLYLAPVTARAGTMVPLLAAALSFVCGATLLLSGAAPGMDASLSTARLMVPLPLLELSHLTGSVAGLLLVILATALYRRYDSARVLASLLLLVGATALLIRQEHDLDAAALLGAAAVLQLGRGAFYRRSGFWRNAVSPASIGLGLLVAAASVWTGLNSFASIPYSHDLWWQFAADASAPRFLRASLLVIVLGLALLTVRLLGPSRMPAAASELGAGVAECVAGSRETSSNLAWLGDKRFLTSPSKQSFIMYQVEGRSWIALGDPVGPRAEWPDLVWQFRELVDVNGGRPVFYEVLGDALDLYAEAGLIAHKIGEEARVALGSFDLERPAAKSFRSALRRAERDRLSLEIVPAAQVPGLMHELKSVSDEWLQSKQTTEKGFSLGFFSPAYLSRFDCAIVRHDGRIVAFANLWAGADGEELSLDLMRHSRDAPKGTMLFLMLSLILRGKAQHFRWFNLGMAPLAGLRQHRLAPRWHYLGHFVFRHAERLYGFAGLRHFKSQFGPAWRPRYMVTLPGFLPFAAGLSDAARLISRPRRQSVRRDAADDLAEQAPDTRSPNAASQCDRS